MYDLSTIQAMNDIALKGKIVTCEEYRLSQPWLGFDRIADGRPRYSAHNPEAPMDGRTIKIVDQLGWWDDQIFPVKVATSPRRLYRAMARISGELAYQLAMGARDVANNHVKVAKIDYNTVEVVR